MQTIDASFGHFVGLNESDAPELLERMTSDDLPVSGDRYGIRSRLIARPKASVADLASATLKKLLSVEPDDATELGAVLVSSRVHHPEDVANEALESIGLKCEGLGIERACSGFPAVVRLALETIDRIKKPVAVIAAEIISRNINWEPAEGRLGDQQRASGQAAKLFADGAGAVIIRPTSSKDSNIILDAWQDHVADDQQLIQKIDVPDSKDPWGNVRPEITTCMSMPGRRGFWLVKRAPEIMADAVKTSLERVTTHLDEASFERLHLVPHQPNGLILDRLAGIEFEEFKQQKVWNCIQDAGNTVSASIPLAMSDSWEKIGAPGVLAMPSVGAGGPGYKPDHLSHGCVLAKLV